MTMTDPTKMTPAELDAAIAVEVMNAETFYWHQREQPPAQKTLSADTGWRIISIRAMQRRPMKSWRK